MCLLQLKQALADILSQQGAQTPQRVRFFRGQMQTIISRALTDLDIKPVPSRRCFALIGATSATIALSLVRCAEYAAYCLLWLYCCLSAQDCMQVKAERSSRMH